MKLTKKEYFLLTVLFAMILLIIYSIYYRHEAFENTNYMDGIDVIYWINLDRSPERRSNMEALLSNDVFNNIDKKRVSATDGKNPGEMYKKLGKYEKQSNTNDYEYGCLISHMDAIKEFSQSNYDVALIMEDDITLELQKYWRKSIRDVINNAPSDWEIITLFSNFEEPKFNTDEYKPFVVNKDYSAVSYLINKKGAKKFIANHYNNQKYDLQNNNQHVSDIYIYDNVKTYLYKFPYFIYKTDNDSTIHSEHLNYHDRVKKNIIAAYENLE